MEVILNNLQSDYYPHAILLVGEGESLSGWLANEKISLDYDRFSIYGTDYYLIRPYFSKFSSFSNSIQDIFNISLTSYRANDRVFTWDDQYGCRVFSYSNGIFFMGLTRKHDWVAVRKKLREYNDREFKREKMRKRRKEAAKEKILKIVDSVDISRSVYAKAEKVEKLAKKISQVDCMSILDCDFYSWQIESKKHIPILIDYYKTITLLYHFTEFCDAKRRNNIEQQLYHERCAANLVGRITEIEKR